MRDYPVKVNLTQEELHILDQLCNRNGMKASETIREAVEYGAAHTDELDAYIQARKLKTGQQLFHYKMEPKEIRNLRLLEAVVGEDGSLRCKLFLTTENLAVKLFPKDCFAYVKDGKLVVECSAQKKSKSHFNRVVVDSESIRSVSVYDERTNRSENIVPMRFECLTEYEYLQIEL